ncbi:hypothetical protein ASPTUDRAFT_61881 [Aspergillus tubingensis CBS 134.48]|uniref:Uncharacterized protein n=1 Tax=Aspergillus tubingensis (strain CBS 134.48) TaxID=767770 RepID=A0A1L9NFF5_ASPTC|nr:hypothetical protein ASPTUDRAFT_61881 [Aspergillus tubingensis CBS 134.48]
MNPSGVRVLSPRDNSCETGRQTCHSPEKESPLVTHKETAKFCCCHGTEASRLESSLRWCRLVCGIIQSDSFGSHPSVGREHGLPSPTGMANLTFVRRQHGELRIESLLDVDPPRGDAYFWEQANRRQMKQSLSAIGISSQR